MYIIYYVFNQCTKQVATSQINSGSTEESLHTTHSSLHTSSSTNEDISNTDQEQVSTTSEPRERDDEHHHHHHHSMYQEKTCHFPGYGGSNGRLSYDW